MSEERRRIFRLLEVVDNFVKYGRRGQEERTARRARRRYEEAAALAEAAGDEELLRQARLRLDDLDRRPGPADADEDVRADGAGDAERVVVSELPPHARARVPPGQRVTGGWPVLHEGRIPRFDPETWRLSVRGACEEPLTLRYDELRALPEVEVRADFHCVTGWSKLDNVWTGVSTRYLLQRARPRPDARHVLVAAPHGYDANLPLDVMLGDDVLLAWNHNGKPLAPKHGGPLRLVVPGLYAWKSVKWVHCLELATVDRRGFWEVRGYHNRADPWREERYSYQE